MCREAKPLDDFHRSARYGRQAWCKDCRRLYDRAYHARNAQKRRRQVRERRQRLVELNGNLKASRPCADCGGRFHPAAMEWDHLPGTEKLDDISTLARTGKTRQFHRELEKCELVCANCHAVRSFARRRGVAQPGRAPGLGPGGRQFESAHPDFRNRRSAGSVSRA